MKYVHDALKVRLEAYCVHAPLVSSRESILVCGSLGSFSLRDDAIVLKPRGKLKSWAQETCSGAHRHLARTMAWSRGPGSKNIFFAGFWAQNDQFWGRNEFQNAEQFRTSKAETSSAVCLEFAETLFSNPFFEAAGALEFLSHADCCTPLASPDIIPSFPRFFGVLKRRHHTI